MALLLSYLTLMLLPLLFAVVFIIGGPLYQHFHPAGHPTKRRRSRIDETDLDVHAHFPESDT